MLEIGFGKILPWMHFKRQIFFAPLFHKNWIIFKEFSLPASCLDMFMRGYIWVTVPRRKRFSGKLQCLDAVLCVYIIMQAHKTLLEIFMTLSWKNYCTGRSCFPPSLFTSHHPTVYMWIFFIVMIFFLDRVRFPANQESPFAHSLTTAKHIRIFFFPIHERIPKLCVRVCVWLGRALKHRVSPVLFLPSFLADFWAGSDTLCTGKHTHCVPVVAYEATKHNCLRILSLDPWRAWTRTALFFKATGRLFLCWWCLLHTLLLLLFTAAKCTAILTFQCIRDTFTVCTSFYVTKIYDLERKSPSH